MKHLHIWGYPAQARPYVLKKRKLDSKTISCYFVEFLEKSWGFKFYDPSTRSIFETRNFFEDIEFDKGNKVSNTDFDEEHDDSVNVEDNLILSSAQENLSRPSTSYGKISYPQELFASRESTIEKGSQISNNEAILEIKENDPINLKPALKSFNAHNWIGVMKEEIKSIH